MDTLAMTRTNFVSLSSTSPISLEPFAEYVSICHSMAHIEIHSPSWISAVRIDGLTLRNRAINEALL